MSDLIDRQTTIERIVSIRPSTPKQSDYSHGVDVGLAMAMVAIKEQPSTEPERKRGRWIIYTISPFDGEDVKCSECGQCGCAPYWNFCPNCGAKMVEDDPSHPFADDVMMGEG